MQNAGDGRLTYTVKEAAELLGRSQRYIYRLVEARELGVVRHRRAVLIPAAELRAWIAKRFEPAA